SSVSARADFTGSDTERVSRRDCSILARSLVSNLPQAKNLTASSWAAFVSILAEAILILARTVEFSTGISRAKWEVLPVVPQPEPHAPTKFTRQKTDSIFSPTA